MIKVAESALLFDMLFLCGPDATFLALAIIFVAPVACCN